MPSHAIHLLLIGQIFLMSFDTLPVDIFRLQMQITREVPVSFLSLFSLHMKLLTGG